jgi:hypothetical protein
MRLGWIDRGHDWRGGVCNDIWHYHDGDWGGDWFHHGWGFYCGDAFFTGLALGSLTDYDWSQPVYVCSPVTGEPCGEIPAPPSGQPYDQTSAQLAVLQALCNPQQDPSQPADPTAGIYVAGPNFDPNNPGQQIEPAYAYNLLRKGEQIYFHPPNGDWEGLNNLDDLNVYLYNQEQKSQAPAQ